MAKETARPDRERWLSEFRARAAEVWGEGRTAAIEAALRRTADAVAKLELVDFSGDDRPGFLLTDLWTPESDAAAKGPAA